MELPCTPLLGEVSETGWLIILGFLLLAALGACSFVYAFCSFPLSRKLESREEAEQDVLRRLESLEASDKTVRYILKKQGLLKSPYDIPSPPLKIDRGSA